MTEIIEITFGMLKKLNYKAGDTVICVKETSGQGGCVHVGDVGVAETVFRTSICRDCVDFQRKDGSFCHVEASAFKKYVPS